MSLQVAENIFTFAFQKGKKKRFTKNDKLKKLHMNHHNWLKKKTKHIILNQQSLQ